MEAVVAPDEPPRHESFAGLNSLNLAIPLDLWALPLHYLGWRLAHVLSHSISKQKLSLLRTLKSSTAFDPGSGSFSTARLAGWIPTVSEDCASFDPLNTTAAYL